MQLAPAYYAEDASRLFSTAPLSRMRRLLPTHDATDDELVDRLKDAEGVITRRSMAMTTRA